MFFFSTKRDKCVSVSSCYVGWEISFFLVHILPDGSGLQGCWLYEGVSFPSPSCAGSRLYLLWSLKPKFHGFWSSVTHSNFAGNGESVHMLTCLVSFFLFLWFPLLSVILVLHKKLFCYILSSNPRHTQKAEIPSNFSLPSHQNERFFHLCFMFSSLWL